MSHLKRLPGRNLFCEHPPQGFTQDFELGGGGGGGGTGWWQDDSSVRKCAWLLGGLGAYPPFYHNLDSLRLLLVQSGTNNTY